MAPIEWKRSRRRRTNDRTLRLYQMRSRPELPAPFPTDHRIYSGVGKFTDMRKRTYVSIQFCKLNLLNPEEITEWRLKRYGYGHIRGTWTNRAISPKGDTPRQRLVAFDIRWAQREERITMSRSDLPDSTMMRLATRRCAAALRKVCGEHGVHV